ncbi:MAG: PCC domain-containing protein [Cyanobium sp.]|jgi:predicted DNA-binding protein with PD1-like motif
MKVMPLRLPPGADLRRALEACMGEQQKQAGWVISAVGSLSLAHLR